VVVLQASVVLIRFSYTGEKGFYIEPDIFKKESNTGEKGFYIEPDIYKDIFKKESNTQCSCNNYLNKITATRIDI